MAKNIGATRAPRLFQAVKLQNSGGSFAQGTLENFSTSPKITISNTAATSENTVENIYALALDSRSTSDSAKITLSDASISLTNATVTGTVAGVVSASATEAAPTGTTGTTPTITYAPYTGSVTGSVTLKAKGVNRIGSLGSDIKNLELTASEVNKTTPVITLGASADAAAVAETEGTPTETASTTALTGLSLKLAIEGGAGTYQMLGSANGTYTISGTATLVSTFTTTDNLQLEAREVTPENPYSITVEEVINNGEGSTTVNENAKTLSESLLGSVALIDQGAEFIASEALPAIARAASSDGVSAFGAMNGGSVRYKTGSHVDVDSGMLVLGGAVKTGSATLAAFAEAGWADSEAHVKNTKSDGDHNYYGAGLAARYDFEAPFYVEGAARVGYSKTEFDGSYGSTGEKAHYDARSLYTSFHVTGGYVFDVTERLKVDAYARYLVSYLDGDTVRLTTAARDKLKLDSATTQTLQAGVRLLGTVNEYASWRAGAAYEHVFGGDADAWIDGLKIDSPSLSGNSGIFEAGATLTPSASSPWKFDLGVKGYVGDRQGVTGSVMVQYLF